MAPAATMIRTRRSDEDLKTLVVTCRTNPRALNQVLEERGEAWEDVAHVLADADVSKRVTSLLRFFKPRGEEGSAAVLQLQQGKLTVPGTSDTVTLNGMLRRSVGMCPRAWVVPTTSPHVRVLRAAAQERFVFDCAELLNLHQGQCFHVWQSTRFAGESATFDLSMLTAVRRAYYDERAYSLHLLLTLLRIDQHPHHEYYEAVHTVLEAAGAYQASRGKGATPGV